MSTSMSSSCAAVQLPFLLRQHQHAGNRSEPVFREVGDGLLHAHGLCGSADRDCITILLQNQLPAFNQREGAFSHLGSIRSRRAEVLSKEQKQDDHRTSWGLKLRTMPELAAYALALLELTTSQAAVERSFSQQALIRSKQRNPPSRRHRPPQHGNS